MKRYHPIDCRRQSIINPILYGVYFQLGLKLETLLRRQMMITVREENDKLRVSGRSWDLKISSLQAIMLYYSIQSFLEWYDLKQA